MQKDEVIGKIADHCGITVDELLSQSRREERVLARHVVMYVLYFDLQLTLKQIGEYMQRDHSTVSHGLQKVHQALSFRYDCNNKKVKRLLKLFEVENAESV